MNNPPPGGRDPLDAVLGWVERKGLQAPAAMLLEMHRPLLPLAWSAAMLAGGVLAPFFGPDYYRKIEALRDPAAIDRLLERLKPPADDSKSGPPEGGTPNEEG